jgi:hypothetical protein
MDNYWQLGRTKPNKNTFYKFFAAANKIKRNYLENFCEVEDARVFGEFCPRPKFAKHEKPNRTPV